MMPGGNTYLSALGFGCMRLPVDKEGKINEDEANRLLEYAYRNGVNYFDSAWGYHDGQSEPFLGRFIARHRRSKLLIATKLPCWLIKKREDMDDIFNQQLERLQTSYIDFYLLHALNRRSWKEMKSLKVLDFLEKARADGKIMHIGFSFHDAYPVFKNIVDSYDWDFCQFMLNYLDTHYQAGKRGYEIAVDKGMGVIAMEPLRGGKLVHPIPDEVKAVWKSSKTDISPQERALRWVWNLPGCTVNLSGMSTIDQVKENVAICERSGPNQIDSRDMKLYEKARREYLRRIAIPCTECRYCLPCPAGVAIPAVLGTYNEAMMFNDRERHTREYKMFLPEQQRADKCTKCGACLSKCPQKIAIPDWMERIADYFG
jgi:predicted aldo/keto reductase-like oxidoreductase